MNNKPNIEELGTLSGGTDTQDYRYEVESLDSTISMLDQLQMHPAKEQPGASCI